MAGSAIASTADEVCVLSDDGTLVGAAPSLDDAQLVRLYRAMVRARRVDRRASALHDEGRIGIHLPTRGQEAAVVGAAQPLTPDDWLFPCRRDLGAALWRGLPLERYLDNLVGNGQARAKGHPMPDHWTGSDEKLASFSSMAASQLIHAVGFSWAAKLRGESTVVLAYMSASGIDSGDYHNALNFAGVFSTPTVVVCKTDDGDEALLDRGVAYGVHSVRCDGDDLFAVMQTVADAVARARRGEGASLVEARVRDAHDPLARMQRYLQSRVGFSDEQQRELEQSIDDELDRAVTQALAAPAPEPASIFDDVFAEPPWHLVQQRDDLLSGPRYEAPSGGE